MYSRGWFLLAFESELKQPLTPVAFGDRRLMVVNQQGRVAVYDADCPHRGAHLPQCGRLDGDVVVCGFHGHRIALGPGTGELRLTPYPAFVHQGLVWVKLSDEACPDLPTALCALEDDHTFLPGFALSAKTSIEIVIENGFDAAHFPSVHGLSMEPLFKTCEGKDGSLNVTGVFEFPRSHWNADRTTSAPVRVKYHGCAFSPGVFVASLEGEAPFNYRIITTATPEPVFPSCTVRVTLVLPNLPNGEPPNAHFSKSLLDASRDGLDKDCAIWNGINLAAANRYTNQDHASLAFKAYCRTFSGED